MEPKNAISTFLVLLPAIIFWFWRASPDYGHSWILVGLMPMLILVCLVLLILSFIFALKRQVFRWWLCTIVNATTVIFALVEFLYF